MIDFSYWFMFPLSVVVSSIAMMSGIGGAAIFSPIFFIFLGLRPDVALGTGIFIEIFGFASGFFGYAKHKLIDYELGFKILRVAIPAIIVGVVIGKLLDEKALLALFSLFMVTLAFMFIQKKKSIVVKHHTAHHIPVHIGKWKRIYTIDSKNWIAYIIASIGGLFMGLVSSGLGESNEFTFIERMKMKTAIASGTSVFVVIVGAFVASVSHFVYLFSNFDYTTILLVLNLIIFAVPGVIIGAQIGVSVAQKINARFMKPFLFALFFTIALAAFSKVLL